ncbi:MFS transporter [Brevibacillus humidisoli]|uniref:MFS transporter n=1 Tax=Brevibacillus humidisoli TaxID=2895522 RepID=UPI001E532769|nr:MFS transporter [Brevibacillus humidisoli]UFJ41217.1 MFS transporter [Brevibacillus humidisoli]
MLQQADASLWSNRVFARMFVSYSLSTFGDWFDFVAMMILFGYVWQADPIMMSLVPVAYAIPGILAGQHAGVLADRYRKLPLMIGADLICGVLTVALLAADSPLLALPLLLCRSAASLFHEPAQQALIRHIVPEEKLLEATTWLGSVFQLSKVLGPLIGSVVLTFASVQLCLIINAASFFISALLLLSVAPESESAGQPESDGENQAPVQMQGAWREGWRILATSRMLLGSFLFTMVAFAAVEMIDIQLPIIFREAAPDQPELTGWCVSAIGIGSFLSLFAINRRKRLRSYSWPIAGGTVLLGLMFLSVGLYTAGTPIIWPLTIAFAGGIGNGMLFAGFTYLVQTETPKEAIGRIYGIIESVRSAIFIIAPLIGGGLVSLLGPAVMFQLTGVLIVLIGTVGFIGKKRIWSAPPAHVKQAETHSLPLN